MRPMTILLAAALAAPAAAQSGESPLQRAEPLFMAARYGATYAVLRNYQPAVRTLRLDFMFGVSGCLGGDDNDRALGLMILNAIPTTYELTTSQAIKLQGYIARCQPAAGVVTPATTTPVIPVSLPAGDDGHGPTYQTTMSLNTKNIAALSPTAARSNEDKAIARFPGARLLSAGELKQLSVAARLQRATMGPPPPPPAH